MKKTIGVLMVLGVLMGCGKETASDLPVITPELSGGTPNLEIFTPAGNVVDAISTMLESVVTDSSSLSSPIDESIWFLETGIVSQSVVSQSVVCYLTLDSNSKPSQPSQPPKPSNP